MLELGRADFLHRTDLPIDPPARKAERARPASPPPSNSGPPLMPDHRKAALDAGIADPRRLHAKPQPLVYPRRAGTAEQGTGEVVAEAPADRDRQDATRRG